MKTSLSTFVFFGILPASESAFFEGISLFSSFHKTGFGLVYSNVENFVFVCLCAHLSLSFHKIGCGSV